MLQALRLQIVSEGQLAHRLLSRSLDNQNGVELEKNILRIDDLKALSTEQLPDVFIVSGNTQRDEMMAVIRIAKGIDHPVLVFSSLLPDPDYVSQLKQLGAFEVVEKTPPESANDSYYRYLGTKISVLCQGAVTHWKRKGAKPQIMAHLSNSNKLPITGSPAKTVIAIGLEGAEHLPLSKLLHSMNRTQGLAFVIAHRIKDEKTVKRWASELNELSDYHIALAGNGSPLKENSVLIAPAGKVMLVHGKTVALDDADEKDQCKLFDFLFDTTGASYRDRAVGVVIGGTPLCGEEGMEKLRTFGGVTFVETPESEAPSHFSNNRRMPASLLMLMLRRHIAQFLK